MCSEGGTTAASVDISESKILWSVKIGNRSSLPLRLGIVISNSIKGLFLGLGVPECNGSCSI